MLHNPCTIRAAAGWLTTCTLVWVSANPAATALLQDFVEWVIGTKLTGDSNVPAGEVSFKAKIGRGSRLGTPDMYPPDMGVIARYRGSGCVAQSGFQQPT